MQFHLVEHSFLSHMAYDPATSTLTLVFRRGEGQPSRVYNYLEVPEAEYEQLLDALNPGSHFQRHLRSAFTYEEVGAESLKLTLVLASGLGFTRFATSPRTSARLELDEVIANNPDEFYHGDDDCGGHHMWFLGSPTDDSTTGTRTRPLWHLNVANGLVVPPTPRLVETDLPA